MSLELRDSTYGFAMHYTLYGAGLSFAGHLYGAEHSGALTWPASSLCHNMVKIIPFNPETQGIFQALIQSSNHPLLWRQGCLLALCPINRWVKQRVWLV